jgi:hypothetical protein
MVAEYGIDRYREPTTDLVFEEFTGAFPFFRSTSEKRRTPTLKTPGS